MPFDNSNSGVLFNKMKTKPTPKHPDYSGNAEVDGRQYYMDGWIQESKKTGEKFLSIKFKVKGDR